MFFCSVTEYARTDTDSMLIRENVFSSVRIFLEIYGKYGISGTKKEGKIPLFCNL
jgi:hypothetical protein